MKNKLLLSIGLLGTFLNLFLAVEFYNKVSRIFVVFIIMLQITKATYLYMLPVLSKKIIFIFLIVLCSLFDLIGVIANCYNTLLISQNLNYKVIANYKYNDYKKQVDELNLAIKEAENKVNTYPLLETFTNNSPSWEDKTQIILTWQDGKNKLLDTKSKLENDLLELNKNIPSKNLKVKVSNNGYQNLFKSSNKLNLILAISFALLMEMIIYSSFLARKNKIVSTGLAQKKEVSTFRVKKVKKVSTGLAQIDKKVSTKVSTEKAKVIDIRGLARVSTGLAQQEIVSTELAQNEKVSTWLKNNVLTGEIIPVSKLKEELNLSKREWYSCKNSIEEIKTVGTKTYYINEKEIETK